MQPRTPCQAAWTASHITVQHTLRSTAELPAAGQWDWLTTHLALQLLLKALRQGSLGKPREAPESQHEASRSHQEASRSQEEATGNLAILDALLPLLVALLKARQAALVSTALRCLGLMLQLPLPGEADYCESTTRLALSHEEPRQCQRAA